MSTSQYPIYVCDFLNQFSDMREIKYKQLNIDFHSVKHDNKESDTIEFFDVFFGKYIDYVKINKNSSFMFILKKISNYETILCSVLNKFQNINIQFIIIDTKYKDNILDKNKDDFLCQYLYVYFQNHNSIMISNDKYRDRQTYIKKFQTQNIKTTVTVIQKLNKLIQKKSVIIKTDNIHICNNILTREYKRTVIPKYKLKNIL